MWAQSWVNILDLVLPYPQTPPEDVTKIMKGQVGAWLQGVPTPQYPWAHRTAPMHLFFLHSTGSLRKCLQKQTCSLPPWGC
jgi:hypothetical protein